MPQIPPIVKDLLLSKKFLVALFTAGGSFAAYLGWNVDLNAILVMMTPFLVYIGAQGWSDSGKEKAKIDGATAIQIHTAAMQMGATVKPSTAPQDNDKPSVTVVTVNQETTT